MYLSTLDIVIGASIGILFSFVIDMLLRLLLQAEYFVLLRMRHVALTPRTLVAVDMVVDVVEETKKNLGFLKIVLLVYINCST